MAPGVGKALRRRWDLPEGRVDGGRREKSQEGLREQHKLRPGGGNGITSV